MKLSAEILAIWTYYYALWIPQYKEGIPDVKSQTLGVSNYKYLVFHKVVCSDTGFIVYKLNLEDHESDFLCEELRHSMPKAIYHYVKNFFHEGRNYFV